MPRDSYSRRRHNKYGDSSSSDEEMENTRSWRKLVDVPDESRGDYRCRICDSRMNTIEMWQTHVVGKRHIKNVNKGPGEAPSKVKTIPCYDKPLILDELHDTDQPIIGLNYVCETRRANSKVAPYYSCYLCHATCTTTSILDHLVSSKHRMNYFEKKHPRLFELINDMPLSNAVLESVIEDHAYTIHDQDGAGCMEVNMEKPKGMSVPQLMRNNKFLQSYRHPKLEEPNYIHPKSERTDSYPKAKPGSSREPQYAPEPPKYGPIPPPVSRTTSSSATGAASVSNESASKASSVLATYGGSESDASGEKELRMEVEEDKDLKLTKYIENATPDQLDAIMKETEEVLKSSEISPEDRLEILRQRCRIIRWIFMLNYYKGLDEDKKPEFKSRLHDRKACLKELSED